MKTLIAIDSFKGSISSTDGSKAIALGITDVYPEAEVMMLPLADGGEGTVEALVQSTKGEFIQKEVTGPLNEKVDAVYGILGDGQTAVIEVASACGLPLVPSDKRNPYVTTTYGVGELICDAIEKGCREFVIGLGGSATNDAGIGMLQALGFSFLDRHNKEVALGGQELRNIFSVDVSSVHPILQDCVFNVACDVNNPLYGENGAAYVFAPQKGASEDMVKELDEGLKHFAQVVFHELNIDIHNIAGAGAAGGLGAAFAGFLHAFLQSGVELVLDLIKMEEKMEGANFIITGEGKLDGQTSMGKAPLGVTKLANKYHIPVIALAGGIEDVSNLNELGITACFSIVNAPMSLKKAMGSKVTFDNLRLTTRQLMQLVQAINVKC
ncbi:glycerate kinase [Priestia megaterium]